MRIRSWERLPELRSRETGGGDSRVDGERRTEVARVEET